MTVVEALNAYNEKTLGVATKGYTVGECLEILVNGGATDSAESGDANATE